MSVVYIMLPVALVLATIGVLAFCWAVRDGQLDDLDGAAARMLDDEDRPVGKR